MILVIHNETKWLLNYVQYLIEHNIQFLDITWRELVRSIHIVHSSHAQAYWSTARGMIRLADVTGIIHDDRYTIQDLAYTDNEDKEYFISTWLAYLHGVLGHHPNVINPILPLVPGWSGLCQFRLQDVLSRCGFAKWSDCDFLNMPCNKKTVFLMDEFAYMIDDLHWKVTDIRPILLAQLKLIQKRLDFRVMTINLIEVHGRYCVIKVSSIINLDTLIQLQPSVFDQLTRILLCDQPPICSPHEPLYIGQANRPAVQS